ncbi:double-strand break repair protein AddB [Methylobacterium organophilum]|uniref:double-strand break repair protein AddB n=1 Tax=Methylobacterium organophilum TaxID=410 RepID=UPI001F139884|nr:double-strand break repair protein AddB [Methylobacterium organophilum]UMY17043.1 double-strand break repair protein AddB [Methylobacterium organophilum]
MPSPQTVFTISPGVPFLPALADALLDGRLVGPVGTDPLALAGVTLYLPTRRAARAFGAVLSRRLPGRAALLPRMIPLGEADEAEFDLAANPLLETAEDVLHPPIPPLERRLILARLVQRWAEEVDRRLLPIDDDVPFLVPSSPADAIGLAGDLERLMDALTVEGLPWEEIGAAVEAEHSRYFGLTLDFLKIAAEYWPKILHERSLSDPVSRARALILAEAERLRRERPGDPVIVAGSTGSVPATARLIAAIAALPRGAVVLPGLDLGLDATGWDAIETGEGESREIAHGHPQAILHRLLGPGCLGLDRSAVTPLGAPDARGAARERILSEALRPADTTDAWAEFDAAARERLAGEGLAGLAVVEATDEREEALIIALALRETLEDPQACAALVTPDRGLALRVSAELARWGLRAEDTAGEGLARSPAGRLARLAAELAAEPAPARVLALLAHPDVRLGLTRSAVLRGAAALEIGALRGPAPKPGFAGMRAAVAGEREAQGRVPRAKRRLTALDWDLAAELVDRLEAAFAGFADDPAQTCNLVAVAGAHRVTCDRLLDGPEPVEDPSLDCLDALFDELALAGEEALPGRFGDYPAFFTALTRERIVPCAQRDAHPRLRILGLLEARLLGFDRVVLGGLDEGVWPMAASTDAFLNRPMRERVGLNPPERRIGQSAHDFVQALGCRDAVITRAAKREGAPTVPSRFLQRLRAFVGPASWDGVLQAGLSLRRLGAGLEAASEPAPRRSSQPKPKPDPALFPRRLSVTEIETLVRDPYAIFAKHVLGLEALEPLAAPPGASERGTLIHAILGAFCEAYPGALPDRDKARLALAEIAANAFGDLSDTYPELYAEWFPRYERMAEHFLAWEAERRGQLAAVHTELSGRWTIPLGQETFTLTARADRIEARRDGGFCIVDYKTGQPPSNKEVFAGFAPQLTLEAAMLMQGGFPGLKAAEVPDLLYVHASGGRKPFEPAELKPPRGEARTLVEIVAEHQARLRGLIARFLTGEAAYTSRPYAKYAKRYSDYDHLARVKEWSLAGDGEGEA